MCHFRMAVSGMRSRKPDRSLKPASASTGASCSATKDRRIGEVAAEPWVEGASRIAASMLRWR